MAKGNELGSFLRARRAATSVADVGLRSYGARRVPGLRRDEVAQLAGVSVDYYTRLEQGRETRPSAQVIDALAHVLGMDAADHRHAYALAQLMWVPPLPDTPPPVDPALVRLMESWPAAACFVLDPVLDILAVNPLAQRLFSPFAATGNLVEMVFLDPAGRTFYADWERAATSCVANLRAASAIHVGARRREQLVQRLRDGSPEFARLWTAHEVTPKTHDSKQLLHPAVGALTVDFDALEVPGMPGHQLVVYRAEPGTVDGQRLRALERPVVDAASDEGVEAPLPGREPGRVPADPVPAALEGAGEQ
jgi:transcriptional regulator with XRE-family HTH domain